MDTKAVTNVLYVPLDERACNYDFPAQLAELTDDIRLIRPPREWMGFKKRPADMDRIWDWLVKEAPSCDYAILSLDTLMYGNIIGSRIHHFTQEECLTRLGRLRELKQRNPRLSIHAFHLVARVAGYDGSMEDPDYWETQGYNIWRYTILKDKIQRKETSEEEAEEQRRLEALIPGENLADFLARRKTGLACGLKCVDMVAEGLVDVLTIPKDDTAEYGYAAMDQAAIAKEVRRLKLMDRVMVYPGADEAGSVLFARVFNLVKNYAPRIYPRYSATTGPFVIPKYEDRPLHEGVKAQITSLGGILADHAGESDCMLAINAPGKHMIESADQYNKDISFSSHINMLEFLRYIRYYRRAYQKPFGLAEVSVCNGCEREFMEYANLSGVLEEAEATGGWNTAQNTIGVVLAQLVIASYYRRQAPDERRQRLAEEFTFSSIVRDWLYQSVALHEFYPYAEGRIEPYRLADDYPKTVDYFRDNLNRLISENFPEGYRGKKPFIKELCFDWDGVFYIRLRIGLESKEKDAEGRGMR